MQQVSKVKEKLSRSCVISHFHRDDVLIKFFLDLTTNKDDGLNKEPIFSVAMDENSIIPFMSVVGTILSGIEKEVVSQVNNLLYSLDMRLTNELSEEFEKPLKIVFNRIGGMLYNTYTSKQYKGYWSIDFAMRFRGSKYPSPDMKGVEISAKVQAFPDPAQEDPQWIKLAWVEHIFQEGEWKTVNGVIDM
jgi:hypothetical protein